MTTEPTPRQRADHAGDQRRAAALLLHYLDDNDEGVRAVLVEAIDNGRTGRLLLATIDVAATIAPTLTGEPARRALRDSILASARLEQDAP